MAKLKFEVPSSLPVAEAVKRVEALLAFWARKYGVKSSWSGTRAEMSGKAVGVTIDGHLEVHGHRVAGEAADPGMLLRGQAQKYLTRKFAQYLDPSKTLQDLLQDD
jgi:hypothetical protein